MSPIKREPRGDHLGFQSCAVVPCGVCHATPRQELGAGGARLCAAAESCDSTPSIAPTAVSAVKTTWLDRAFECTGSDVAYLLERQVAGAVPNAFLKAREKAASEL